MSDHSENNGSSEEERSSQECMRRAKEHSVAGGALGAVSIGGLVAFGSVACPLCLVAAPALLCSGAWNAHKGRKKNDERPEKGYDGLVDPEVCDGD